MMGNPKYSDSIKKQPGLVYELSTVLQARTPDDLSPQKPGIRQPEDAVQRFL
jgi:hypothetical protein